VAKYDELRWRLSRQGVNVTAEQLEGLSRSQPETFKYYTRMISQMRAVTNTAHDVYTTRGMAEQDHRQVVDTERRIFDNFIKWLQKQLL